MKRNEKVTNGPQDFYVIRIDPKQKVNLQGGKVIDKLQSTFIYFIFLNWNILEFFKSNELVILIL